MRDQAINFHARHPEVWVLFVRYTLEKIESGFKNYSARGIFHRIRWETPAGDDGKAAFKINNNHSPFYARRFMRMYPEHAEFFRTRHQLDAPATGLPELRPRDFGLFK